MCERVLVCSCGFECVWVCVHSFLLVCVCVFLQLLMARRGHFRDAFKTLLSAPRATINIRQRESKRGRDSKIK